MNINYIGVEFYLTRGGGGGGGGKDTYTDTGKLGRGWETLQTIHAFVHISIEGT